MARNTCYTMDEPDGTMFQELVLFPTLAPQLARAENRYIGPAVNAAQAGAGQAGFAAGAPVANAGAVIVGDDQEEAFAPLMPPERTFFITAIMNFTQPPSGPKAKPSKGSESKTGAAIALF